jgi:hypothetical protein
MTVVLLLLLFGVNPGGMTIAAVDAPPQAKIMDGVYRSPVVLRADPNVSTHRVPAPVHALSSQGIQNANITIYYIPAGGQDFYGEDCFAWPPAAQTAFSYAASIWETLIHSPVTIVIHACWADLGAGYLGYGGVDNYQRDFTGAPTPNTWYPAALANALAGSDLSPARPDMHLAYNQAMGDEWYFGTDGIPGAKYDFVSVVLHEIAHGLGFAGTMWVSSGVGEWGFGSGTISPDSYDRFTEDGSGNALLNTVIYPNPSTALAVALTSGNVWFDGSHANAANGGGRVKLYAPSSWSPGSSYSHLDEIFNNTENSLMTYSLSKGSSEHSPGPVTMGILRDIGWPSGENTPPTLSDLPDQTLTPGQSKNGAINLWTYASDAQDIDANLTFTITNSPPLTVGVMIRDNQYIDINPTGSFTGTFPVVVEVLDTGGLTDTDSFTITFLDSVTRYVYLPMVARCYPLVPYLSPISNPDGDGLYTIQWTMPSCSTQTPSQYEFQLATDPGFSYVDGDTTTQTYVNVYTPDPATYYWRVRAYINGQWTGWSNVQSVTVGAFSYAFVYNATGGTLTIEIGGIEKRSFVTGFEGYWRSVPVGIYTVKVWARCGYLQESLYFPLGEFHDLAFQCVPAASLSSAPSTTAVPGVDFVFKSTAP